MKAFFDTSVLVAAFWGDHPNHDASLDLLVRAAKNDAACAAHSLAEVYAVMTRLPVKPVLPAEQAVVFLQEIEERLTVVNLETADYSHALQQAARQGIVGGRIYDALLLACARKVAAQTIYTLNLRDFLRLAPDLADRIRTP